MGRGMIEAAGRGVEEIVTSFEAAWLVAGEAELTRFLPEVGHPDRLAALRELVRVDMERRWSSGRTLSLEDYLLDFPELGGQAVADLALTEYRLRRGSGEWTSPDEYRRRFGVETSTLR